MRNDNTAAQPASPYIKEPWIDPVSHRAEVEHVIAAAMAAITAPILKRLKRLRIVEATGDYGGENHLQIGSDAIGRSGIEFRFAMPAWRTGVQQLGPVIADLVRSATRLANTASRLREFGELLSDIAAAAIAPAASGMAPMSVVAVGIYPRPDRWLTITVDVRMLACDLSVGVERVSGGSTTFIGDQLAGLVAAHLRRRSALAQAIVAGGSGWIDDVAARLLDLSGIDLAHACELLRCRSDLEFGYGGVGSCRSIGSVHWSDGTIRADVASRGAQDFFRVYHDVLSIEAEKLPATVAASLAKRRLRDVIDFDIIPADALIVDVREADGRLRLTLQIGRRVIQHA
ncbi:hypothetical protein [Sphingomonas sp. BAUL-RG-20F-R05-02]|uniref:hypothetical protein n=1 Tax=Sphingomonas sp. BAUL-RG-20F-R05-02 TaxID=2914830 RepID=UPI001F5A640A|nr:hypothetical protein [Sphingomonas sp. BAUL-RG-20F-R05-02]